MSPSAISTRSERMAATESRLSAVSRRLTAERGLNGFTVEEVCAEVGVSRRTFFNYFPTKEDAIIGIDESEAMQQLVAQFLERGSRGWAAVVDDLIELAEQHARAAGFGVAEHVELVAAIEREPKLLAHFIGISREREQQLAELIAAREGTTTSDPLTRAAVQIVATTLRLSGERMLHPTAGDDDFAAALTDSLAAIRAVLATSEPQKDTA